MGHSFCLSLQIDHVVAVARQERDRRFRLWTGKMPVPRALLIFPRAKFYEVKDFGPLIREAIRAAHSPVTEA